MLLFWLVSVSFCFIYSQKQELSLLKPYQNAILGEPYELTCKLKDLQANTNVTFSVMRRHTSQHICMLSSASDNDSCILNKGCDRTFEYVCDPENQTYILKIPGYYVTKLNHQSRWFCHNYSYVSGQVELLVDVPISEVNLSKPTNENGFIEIDPGVTIDFTCTTDLGNPRALVRWYIANEDISQLSTIRHICDWMIYMYECEYGQHDDRLYSAQSILTYRGNTADHKKTIYCEGGNIEGRNIKSKEYILYIQNNLTVDWLNKEKTMPLEAGVGIGAGGMFLLYSLIVLAVIMIKRFKFNTTDKDKIYEETKKDTSELGPYSELREMPTASKQSLDEVESRTTYEEVQR